MSPQKLSRREREILDVLYQTEEASAQQVMELMPDPPSYSSVRALLARMIEKELVTHRQEGAKYLYQPAQARAQAQSSALSRMLKTFFDGSIALFFEGGKLGYFGKFCKKDK